MNCTGLAAVQDLAAMQDRKILLQCKIARSCSIVRYVITRKNYHREFCKISPISCKKWTIFIARLASLARYAINTCKMSARRARKIIASLANFLQDGFYWEKTNVVLD